MNKRNLMLIVLVCAGLLQIGAAEAAVNLRFTPADTVVSPGTGGRLSVMIDDLDANVRTIDVFVTYDTTIVASVAGGPGALYEDSGFFVFDGFENDTPGQWHGYAVVMGSGDFLEGPGELYYWDFQGLVDGSSAIIAVEAYVAAGDGTYYPDVILDPTTITVSDPLSAVGDVPESRPNLRAWPNPFNPITSLTVNLPTASEARLAVYDLRGRELLVLHEGAARAGSTTFTWDGRDKTGRLQPAGQYFFRLDAGNVTRSVKVTLVK